MTHGGSIRRESPPSAGLWLREYRVGADSQIDAQITTNRTISESDMSSAAEHSQRDDTSRDAKASTAQGAYVPAEIEAARQADWAARDAFRTPAIDDGRPHRYIKPSAPFTSGNIHIGHVRSYSIGDAYARFNRARGESVLFAFGFDAFGLPAELGAIAQGVPPAEWVQRCAEHMHGQLLRLGFSFDWDRAFMSSDTQMYRWSQWLFLTLLQAGLIYRGTGSVDWCDHCQTTLASIQVEDGLCWRCHNPVRLIQRPQWVLRISAYLEENDRRIGELHPWDETSLASQRYVLGRVDGVEADLKTPEGSSLSVFTPHRDAVEQARFVLISPRHREVELWANDPAVQAELEEMRSAGLERSSREPEAVPLLDTGRSVISPDGQRRLPVIVSPVVDARFGVTIALGSQRRTAPTRCSRAGSESSRRRHPRQSRRQRRRRSERQCATRLSTSRSRGNARGARRSRSSTASAAGPCRCRWSSSRWSCRGT